MHDIMRPLLLATTIFFVSSDSSWRMEENKGKRKAPDLPDGPPSSQATATKETREAVASTSSKEPAADVTPSSAPATASTTKKVKREEEGAVSNTPKEELVLEWDCYNESTAWESSETTRAVSVDELIRNRMTLSDCREAMENEKDDCDNRDFRLKLVLRGSPPSAKQGECTEVKKILASLNFTWWEDSAKANLMHFNIMSQDLADFCRSLWKAAGRPYREYNDMAIEFGESRHSWVEVNDLIMDATDSYAGSSTTYLDLRDIYPDKSPPMKKEHGDRLMNGLLALVGEDSSIVTHRSDLSKLNVDYGVPFGFRELRGRDSGGWFVRSAL